MNARATVLNPCEQPDEVLADLAIRGTGESSGQAFETLYRRHVDRVFGYCFRLLGNREAAEDATSDVFLAVVRGIHAYRPMKGKSFRSWLFAIAHHVIMDHRTKRIRETQRTTTIDLNHPDRATSPSDLAVAADEGRWIRTALAVLSSRERDVIELDLAGLSTAEIGAVLHVREGSVYTARSRALEKLRAHLVESDSLMEATNAIRPTQRS